MATHSGESYLWTEGLQFSTSTDRTEIKTQRQFDIPITIVKQDEVEWILGRKLEEFSYYVGTCTNTAQETLNKVSGLPKKGSV